MTKRDLYDRFVPVDRRMSLLQGQYEAALLKQLGIWAPGANADALIQEGIDRFCQQITVYALDTDCLVALMACLREVLLEALSRGALGLEDCHPRIWACHQARIRIGQLPEKQMNLILSQFNRKLFDYFIRRYFYLEDIPIQSGLERKITSCFRGKGKMDILNALHGFSGLEYTEDVLAASCADISPHFLCQIGTGKTMICHPAVTSHSLIQYEANQSRMAFSVVLILLLVILLLAFLSQIGLFPF